MSTGNVTTCQHPISVMEVCGASMSRNGTCPNKDNHVITSGRSMTEAQRGKRPGDADRRAAETWARMASSKINESVRYYRTAASYLRSAGDTEAAQTMIDTATQLEATIGTDD